MKTKKLIIIVSLMVIVIAGLLSWRFMSVKQNEQAMIQDTLVDFELPEGPTIQNTSYEGEAPLYMYLFTHTEDPFNHELSEERYWKVGEMIRDMDASYPSVNITWVLEFIGADAKTVTDRNNETGLVDYLLELQKEDLVEFGYHAHHDPTYMNRPQNELSNNPSFGDVYDALFTWITCEKDLQEGGCVEERGGGLEAILNTFSEVAIVTGVGYNDGFLMERSAGTLAIQELLPNRLLGFGISDHGPVVSDRNLLAAQEELMQILTPANDTSSGTFWMDGAVRINGDAMLENAHLTKLMEGSDVLTEALNEMTRDVPIVANIGIASKYLYTNEGESPTQWGYANPDAPELPINKIVPESQRTKNYKLTEQSLNFLAQYLSEHNGTFVNSEETVELFVSDDYWNVTEEEVTQIALWILNEWDNGSPNWVYDGEDYYSLTDAFVLLVSTLDDGSPDDKLLNQVFGPWSRVSKRTNMTSIAVEDLEEWVKNIEYKDHQIEEIYTIAGEQYTATQLLYALSYAHIYRQYDVSSESILLPKMNTAPKTYDLLEDMGCIDCFDSAWSLKPARFH